MDKPADPAIPVSTPTSAPVTPNVDPTSNPQTSPVQEPVSVTSVSPQPPVVGKPDPVPVTPASQTDQKTPTQPVPPVSPAPAPTSAPKKEAGPIGGAKPVESVGQPNWAEADKVAKEENDQYWEKYAAEIEGEKRVEDLGGIEKMEKGEAIIPPDLAKEMGVKPVAPKPANDPNGFSVRGVSLSDDQVISGKKMPASSGFRWLVEWFVLQLHKAHSHLKKSLGGATDKSL